MPWPAREFGPGVEATVTYLPGYQSPTYFLSRLGRTLPQPSGPERWPQSEPMCRRLSGPPCPRSPRSRLSYGPFVITDWVKGERIELEVNPYYEPAPKVQKIIVIFVQDTNQAVAQLLAGDVDYLERATLGGGAEVQTVIDAAAEGKVNVEIIPSPTWEHIDMNLYTK